MVTVQDIKSVLANNSSLVLPMDIFLRSLLTKYDSNMPCNMPSGDARAITFDEFSKEFLRLHDEELALQVFNSIDADKSQSVTENEMKIFFERSSTSEKRSTAQSDQAGHLPGHSDTAISKSVEPDGISLDGFKKAFNEVPRVRGDRLQFIRSLKLDAKLARLLRKGSALDGMSGLLEMPNIELEQHIEDVCRRFVSIVHWSLCKGLHKLRKASRRDSVVQEHINSKFVMDRAFVGCFATLNDFYKGPEALIGVPNPDIRRGMKQEHCKRKNAKVEFVADNYNVRTCPYTEWLFVVNPAKGSDYPHTPRDKSQWKDQTHLPVGERWRGEYGRDIICLKDFLAQPAVEQERKKAGLLEDEIIAARLYTGPMYVLYNAALRGRPEDKMQCLMGNKYETTIFTLVSAIVKLSKVTVVPENRKLYRGLGGMVLPDQFWSNFAECRVSFVALVKSKDQVEAAKRALEEKVSLCDVRVLESNHKLPAPMLKLSTFRGTPPTSSNTDNSQSISVRYLRVISEGKVTENGDGVELAISLAMPKSTFTEEEQRRFKRNIIAIDPNIIEDVIIEEISDKPSDFKGAGVAYFFVLFFYIIVKYPGLTITTIVSVFPSTNQYIIRAHLTFKVQLSTDFSPQQRQGILPSSTAAMK